MSDVADRLREHVRMRALVAHGGGPTAVLNASLAGLVSGCRGRYKSLVASAFGFEGLLSGRLTDLLSIPEERWAAIRLAPGSVIGSSRKAFDPEAVATALREAGIDTVFLTGGNGTMGTALELSRRGVRVTGIPKTIDNDLAVTHHSPGYASTAYFFACAARDIGMDVAALPSPICVLETLGRNAGWITAATALARTDVGSPCGVTARGAAESGRYCR
jgi:ATP-dependent phosphofructokinase / diphosphate-dependent phosphofructokinase